MRRVHYIAPFQDTSGYAVACRNYIASIIQHGGVNLSLEAVSFEQEKAKQSLAEGFKPYIKPGNDAQIRIIHLTPENFPVYRRTNAYNIGYTTWEADPIPRQWVSLCNSLEEIWVPSDWNVDVFRRAGVTKPIYKLIHGVSLPPAQLQPLDIVLDQFLFYSIFQWIERKNPTTLLTAYLTEFKQEEPVVLLLKTYRMNSSEQEQNQIRQDIRVLKDSLNLPVYPNLVYIKELLSSEDIHRLHVRGNCFVLPSRGEGFGLPFAEAMAHGNPVIGPRYGGCLEFLNDENSYLIPCVEVPVSGMTWMKHYNASMTWGQPDVMELRKTMRYVYENRGEALTKGQAGMATIRDQFSWAVVGKWIVDRINAIQVGR